MISRNHRNHNTTPVVISPSFDPAVKFSRSKGSRVDIPRIWYKCTECNVIEILYTIYSTLSKKLLGGGQSSGRFDRLTARKKIAGRHFRWVLRVCRILKRETFSSCFPAYPHGAHGNRACETRRRCFSDTEPKGTPSYFAWLPRARWIVRLITPVVTMPSIITDLDFTLPSNIGTDNVASTRRFTGICLWI